MDEGGGQKRETSSTALRSCRAGRNTAAPPPQTAWCRSRRSSACRPRWGRNGRPRSNSSTSRRGSESRAEVSSWSGGGGLKRAGAAYHPAFPRRQLQDAFSWTLPVTAGEIQRLLQEPLGADVIEEQRAQAGAHRHYVLVEAHRTDAWAQKHAVAVGQQPQTE